MATFGGDKKYLGTIERGSGYITWGYIDSFQSDWSGGLIGLVSKEFVEQVGESEFTSPVYTFFLKKNLD